MPADNISKVLKSPDVSIKTLDGTVIKGKVNLAHENRVSDLFTKMDNPFVVAFDADFFGSPEKRVLVLNKQHIVWAVNHKSENGDSLRLRLLAKSRKNMLFLAGSAPAVGGGR